MDDSGVGGVTPTQIRAAVASLDSENTEHFTQAGKPRVAAVVAALGAEVTGKQIEAALAEGRGRRMIYATVSDMQARYKKQPGSAH